MSILEYLNASAEVWDSAVVAAARTRAEMIIIFFMTE
jgi:hypothetical protein